MKLSKGQIEVIAQRLEDRNIITMTEERKIVREELGIELPDNKERKIRAEKLAKRILNEVEAEINVPVDNMTDKITTILKVFIR